MRPSRERDPVATLLAEVVWGMLTSNLSKKDPARNGSKKPLAGRRILVAEDEALIALELERVLTDFGCDVVGPLASVDEVLESAQHDGAGRAWIAAYYHVGGHPLKTPAAFALAAATKHSIAFDRPSHYVRALGRVSNFAQAAAAGR